MTEYIKVDDSTLAVTAQVENTTKYSYSDILRSIENIQKNLEFWQNLKNEADKLALK